MLIAQKENERKEVPYDCNKIKIPWNRKNQGKKPEEKMISMISIDSIRPNPYQPRRKFDNSSLDELCNSIKQYGVIQPINVRKTSKVTTSLLPVKDG